MIPYIGSAAKGGKYLGKGLKYVDDVVKAVGKYGDEVIKLFSKYGTKIGELFVRYGDEVIQVFRKYGDEAVEIFRKYGDNAIQWLKKQDIGDAIDAGEAAYYTGEAGYYASQGDDEKARESLMNAALPGASFLASRRMRRWQQRNIGGAKPNFDDYTNPAKSKLRESDLGGSNKQTDSANTVDELFAGRNLEMVGVPRGTKLDVDSPTGTKQAEIKIKTSETDIHNGRTTHADKPEIEPGIVAKEKAVDGHEIKVLKDGRVVRCSNCGTIRNQNQELFTKRPELDERLSEIERISDPKEKSLRAKAFDSELAQIKEAEKLTSLPGEDIIDISKIPEQAIKNDAYTAMREASSDIEEIAELTELPKDLVDKAKQHFMFEKHILVDAETGQLYRGTFEPYDPSEDIGVAAWEKIVRGEKPSQNEIERLKHLIIHEAGESKILKSDYEAIEILFKRGQLEDHLRNYLQRAGVKENMINIMIEMEVKPIQPHRYAHYVAHYSGYKN